MVLSAGHPTSLRGTPIRLSAQALASKPDTLKGEEPSEESSSVLITNKLYSGFLEHVGRCIYGGIVDDPANPSDKKLLAPFQWTNGLVKEKLPMRTDVMNEVAMQLGLQQKQQQQPQQHSQKPLLRWPGGNFVSNYHWQDGIGPLDKRPSRIELAWHGTESNLFGTDEFLEYCEKIGAEPFICLNMGTGTLEEALAWVEYCNGTEDTYWANLRRRNTGRKEPFDVRYWGLGNEMWAEWQIGRLTATQYADMASRWAHALRTLCPSIKLVSCGKEGGTTWDYEVLKALAGEVDLHSIHYYSVLSHQKHVRSDEEPDDAEWGQGAFSAYEKNVFGASVAEQHIQTCARLIDLAVMEQYTHRPLESLQQYVNGTPTRPIGICMDEWNVWDDHKATPTRGLEQTYDFTDMLGVLGWLHVLVRNADRVAVACLAQSVNVLSPLLTSARGTLRQATFYPVSLFAEHMCNGFLMQHTEQYDLYNGPTYPAWLQNVQRPRYVDVVAVYVPKTRSVHVSIVNRHPLASWRAPIAFVDGFRATSVTEIRMTSDDLKAKNSFDEPDKIKPTITTKPFHHKEGEADDILVVGPHSWSLFLFF